MKQEIKTFQHKSPYRCNAEAMEYAEKYSKKIISANLTMDSKINWFYLTVVFEEVR